ADRLQALTAALAATTTPADVAEVVVAQGVAAAGAATGVLALRAPAASADEPPEGTMVRQHGASSLVVERYRRFPLDAPGPLARCLRTGAPVFVEDAGALRTAFPEVPHIWDSMGTEAVATVPLTVADAVIGAISFSWTAPRELPTADREFFLAVGRQAAQALERARLIEAEHAARERAERLQALTAALARARALDDVARVVVAEMVVALGARTGAMAVRAPAERELMVVGHVGFDPRMVERIERQPMDGGGPVPLCFRTGAPVWIERRDGPDGFDARFPALVPVWAATGVAAGAVVPLVAGAETVGTISFGFGAPRGFAAEERAFLLSLGQQAALALERVRLFDAERAARRDAEAANRGKGEFLAVMSHELRTPLNAIGGYAELLELGVRGPITEAQRDDLARIQQSQRHLLGLINQVLNYTRVDAGAVRYDVADVPVLEALAAAEALVQPQVRARGLAFATSGCDAPWAVRADRDKLQQVLLNLLSNAIKFTEPGGAVRVHCRCAADVVAIAVSDTGVGIAPDKLATIFEPFVQVDQRLTRPHEGVGLGLAISRDLARGMGGELTVESTPGAGSTFTLTLPAA
ncbi:GAF domain-containing sensor histidine kinase, partial [Roseisolibacter sp. H3M3-2]|uniref:sensor histidine kinase n=1 Tax=Roseisolibacter sp. H3M3-2 TaxID=3031323 RepID=UPI0023DABB97